MNKNDSLHKVANQPKAVVTPDHIPSLLQLQMTQKLRMQGYSVEEADELCRAKEMDLEAVMRQIMVWEERELRRLAKLNPKLKQTPRPQKVEDDKTEMQISDVDLRPDLKWMATVRAPES